MKLTKILNQIFKLYSEGKYKEAQELNNKILEQFPDDPYAKRYEKILAEKLKLTNLTGSRGKTVKVSGKSLKCPHCLAKIPFSSLTESQRKEIKKGNYNNLEIKCPYCHTKFVLQKKQAKSIIGIKIGDIATIEGKKYRAVGYVEYSGMWYEDFYSGGVKYLEWLLLGENNEYRYFSEGSSSDDGVWEQEFELSEKYIPKQIGQIDYTRKKAEIDGKVLYTKEIDRVRVVSVYGENSKNTKIGEKVELYDFGNIIIEKENSGSQSESGFYKTKELSGSEAASIFGKEYNKFKNIASQFKESSSNSGNIFTWIFLIFVFGIQFLALIPKEYLFGGIFLIIIGIFLYFFKDKMGEKGKIILAGILIIPISAFLIFKPIFSSILENKKLVTLDKIDYGKKYEIQFKDSSLKKEQVLSRTTYDYGGVRTYYKKIDGLKFSVKNKNDLELIEKIKNLRNKKLLNSSNEEKIKKVFSGPVYKLK